MLNCVIGANHKVAANNQDETVDICTGALYELVMKLSLIFNIPKGYDSFVLLPQGLNWNMIREC